jgi:hypothetical protein
LPEIAAWLIKTTELNSHGSFFMQVGFWCFSQFFRSKKSISRVMDIDSARQGFGYFKIKDARGNP